MVPDGLYKTHLPVWDRVDRGMDISQLTDLHPNTFIRVNQHLHYDRQSLACLVQVLSSSTENSLETPPEGRVSKLPIQVILDRRRHTQALAKQTPEILSAELS